MVKIVVYEDSVDDIFNRYGHLTRHHEVHVRYFPSGQWYDSLQRVTKSLVRVGFTRDRIQEGNIARGDPEERAADVFFIDGLLGAWLRIMQRLPRERAFLCTGSEDYAIEARQRGFKVIPRGSLPASP